MFCQNIVFLEQHIHTCILTKFVREKLDTNNVNKKGIALTLENI